MKVNIYDYLAIIIIRSNMRSLLFQWAILAVLLCLFSLGYPNNSTVVDSTLPSSTTQSSTTGVAPESTESSPNRCRNYGPISTIITRFSNHLASIIDGEDNLFFSPLSISLALAMLYLGARGETAKSMEIGLSYNILNSNELPGIVHELYRNTLNSLEYKTEAYTLEVANGMFIQDGILVSPAFIHDLQEFYNVKLYPVNFNSDGESAVSEINEWVSHYTQGKISALMSEPLDPMTVLLLANAIYFKGFWKIPFDERETKIQNFYTKNDTITRVPFMEYKKMLPLFRDNKVNYTFLEMDYRGGDISMIFALPYDRSQFPTLEITESLMCRVRNNLRPSKVHVILPKFSLSYERELSHDLHHLGMSDLFSESHANLTGIRYQNDLFVSGVLHKAVIEVNEQGSEATAATGVSFNSRSGHTRYSLFKANHPFLFCIIDKRTGTILFLGRVVDL